MSKGEIQIYVACLAAYNNGILHGRWIDAQQDAWAVYDDIRAMLDASPKGTVPVLVAGPGEVIEESRDIMRWALVRSDPEGWLDRDDAALIEINDGSFKHHLDRYKYATRYEDAQPDEHRAAALEILEQLERRLERRAYLCGDTRGFADIAIFPFIRQFANTDKAWFAAQDLPRVQAWLEGLVNSDLFAAIMTKRPQWKAAF